MYNTLGHEESLFPDRLEPQSQRYTSFQPPFGTWSYLKCWWAWSVKKYTSALSADHGYCIPRRAPLRRQIIGRHPSEDQRLQHLTQLADELNRLRRARPTLNMDKCHPATDRIQIFGFQVDKGLITPDAKKARVVSDFHTPKTKKTIASFVGLVKAATFGPGSSAVTGNSGHAQE